MLTFEKIRDMERAERENKELQKLPENILEEINEYLHRKERIDKSSELLELENVKNIIKRLFELREQKIANMVLYTVKTGLPPNNLMSSEEKLFNQMRDALKNFREDFFAKFGKEPKEKKVYFIATKSTSEFIGPDMKMYKLNENDKVDLPKPLNELLLKEGVIKRIEE